MNFTWKLEVRKLLACACSMAVLSGVLLSPHQSPRSSSALAHLYYFARPTKVTTFSSSQVQASFFWNWTAYFITADLLACSNKSACLLLSRLPHFLRVWNRLQIYRIGWKPSRTKWMTKVISLIIFETLTANQFTSWLITKTSYLGSRTIKSTWCFQRN